MDPYINGDAGTMSPYQQGAVFVTDDGGEPDLDLGHYERFTSGRVTRDHNVTTGKVYFSVIQKERRGDYLGRTVQVIPHITDEIKASIRRVSRDTDVVIVEVGGTVGDIEGLPFLEAIRQFKKDVGRENVIYVHLTLVPFMQAASELKTKATQHSVKELRAIGIQPDILLCRTDRYLPPGIKSKIALFCDVEEEAVITAKDVETIYEVPLVFHREGLDDIIVKLLGLPARPIDLSRWEEVVARVKSPRQATRVAVVGKYIELKDSYKSLIEALAHGGIANDARVVGDSAVGQGLDEALVRVFQLDVLADDGDAGRLARGLHAGDDLLPPAQVDGPGGQAEELHDDVVESLAVEHQRHLVDRLHVLGRDDGLLLDVTEQRDLRLDRGRQIAIGAAEQDVGLDPDGPQLLDRML